MDYVIPSIDVDKVLTELKSAAARAANEEEFKINAERILYSEVLESLVFSLEGYEYTFVSGGRVDAFYGHLIIEYEAPGNLSTKSGTVKAKEQTVNYIKKEAEVEERYGYFLGEILCDKIAFVRYDVKNKDWVLRGPYDRTGRLLSGLLRPSGGLDARVGSACKMSSKTISSTSGFGMYGSFGYLQASVQKPKWFLQKTSIKSL
jgi:hypothetical protein